MKQLKSGRGELFIREGAQWAPGADLPSRLSLISPAQGAPLPPQGLTHWQFDVN